MSQPVGSMWSIIGVYSQATPQEVDDGKNAYAGYKRTMENFASFYGFPVETVTGVFAALSPVNDFWGNLRSLRAILEGVKNNTPVKSITTSTTNRNKQNAYDIATGSPPVSRLKGKKVWAFHSCILDPDSSAHVVIDRHCQSVWIGRRSHDGRVPYYDKAAHDYREAAKLIGLVPSQLQSCVWLAWKRLENIRYDGHPDLFYSGTNLRTVISVDEVKAFSPK